MEICDSDRQFSFDSYLLNLFFKFHKNSDIRKLKAWSFRLLKNDFCRLYRVYKKKVIELWSTLACSLYNLPKSFFHSHMEAFISSIKMVYSISYTKLSILLEINGA